MFYFKVMPQVDIKYKIEKINTSRVNIKEPQCNPGNTQINKTHTEMHIKYSFLNSTN